MTRPAAAAADVYQAQTTNEPGMCLKETRTAYGIPSLYADAAQAWEYALGKHPGDKTPPHGAPVYWTGGSSGYGHIAIWHEQDVRSSDAAGRGLMGSRYLDWFTQQWGLQYVGWAESVNGIYIPELGDDDMALSDDDVERIAERVWAHAFENASGSLWTAKQFLYWIHANVNKVLDKV